MKRRIILENVNNRRVENPRTNKFGWLDKEFFEYTQSLRYSQPSLSRDFLGVAVVGPVIRGLRQAYTRAKDFVNYIIGR